MDQRQKQCNQRSQHQQAESAEQSRRQQAPSLALFRVCILHLAPQRRLGFVQGVRCRLAVQQAVSLCLEKQDPQGGDQHSGGVFLQKESQHRRENQNSFFRRNPLSADLGQGLQNQRSTGKQRCRETGGHPQAAQRRDQSDKQQNQQRPQCHQNIPHGKAPPDRKAKAQKLFQKL